MEGDSMHELIPIKTKPPQPARPGSPSLITLGYDVTSLVIDELLISSPSTLLSVALVSSYYYELARYSKHGKVALRLGHGGPKSFDPSGYGDRAEQCADLLEWLNQTSAKGLLPAIRHLTVHIERNNDTNDLLGKQTRDTLAAHLSHMTGLADLTWIGDEILPNQIVQVLSDRPGLRLHVHYKAKDRGIHDTEHNPHIEPLSVLVGLANLESLSIESDYATSRQCHDILHPVKNVLLTGKNLLKLRLNIHLPSKGGFARGLWKPTPTTVYREFGFVDGERPAAALRELELIDYPLRYGARGLYTASPGSVSTEAVENYWADTFDWSRLERLVINGLNLASKMLPHLKSLRHIGYISPIPEVGLIKNFLNQLPDGLETIRISVDGIGLETISLSVVDGQGLEALLRHGSTLRKLSIHQTDGYMPDGLYSEAVQESAMRRIRDTCVVLEDLEVDIALAGNEWPYAMLDIIASFPRLRRLRLWFDIGFHDIEKPVKPYTTASGAQHLFDYVLSQSTVTPSRLRSIMIYLGDPWGRPPLHYTAWSDQPVNPQTVFQCHVSDRDDDAPPHTYKFNVAYITWPGFQCD